VSRSAAAQLGNSFLRKPPPGDLHQAGFFVKRRLSIRANRWMMSPKPLASPRFAHCRVPPIGAGAAVVATQLGTILSGSEASPR
jgi:hypothetical protein